MPNYGDLVALLSSVHITDRNRDRAHTVAGHLVKSVLRERWDELTERQQRTLIRDSGNRLWRGYMEKRKNEFIEPREAAQDAIFDERATLEELLNPSKAKSGLLQQLDDFSNE